jgi:DNA repair and recombination protein RAD52
MTFTEAQNKALAAPLDRNHVAQRQQGGGQVSYIEAWHAIAEANRIFGFDGWTRETIDLRQLGEPYEVNGKVRVNYSARVRVTVGGVVREGCGFGQGIDKDVGQAHESGLKEAETDAMKRALMTFGNPFGLALYDKSQANVGTPPQELPTGPINDATRDWIADKIDGRQIPVGELCKAFSVTSLKGLTYEQLDAVKAWIRDHKKEAA